MTWSLVGAVTTGTDVASGNVTGTLPTGNAQGDVLLATVAFRGTATFTPPTGWTLVGSQLTGDTLASAGIAGISQYICYRSGTTPGTVWTRTAGDLGVVRIACFRSNNGAIASGNLRASNVAQTSGQVTAAAVSSVTGITPDVNGCLIYLACVGADNGTWSALSTASIASGSWTALGTSLGTNTGADGALHAAYFVQTTAAATGNAQGTLSIAGRNALAILAISEPAVNTVNTGSQTTNAVTQSATASATAYYEHTLVTETPDDIVTEAGDFLAVTAIPAAGGAANVDGAQTLSATTQSGTVAVGLAVTGAQTLGAVTQSATAKAILAVTGSQTLSATSQSATVGVRVTVTGSQTLSACTTAGTIGSGIAVTGNQTLSACITAGTIALTPEGAAVVNGSQTTLACTTSGDIALGEVVPVEPELPVAPGGPSRAAQRRLKQAVENRSRFEAERARRLASLTNDRPLFVTPPETLEMINEVLVEEIDHSVLFEDEDQDEHLLLLLAMT